jgi:DNA-binding NtrC family response regulator
MQNPTAPASSTKRILLVDDDERVLFVLSTSLRRTREPCEVVTARDGWTAYGLLRDAPFDLLITDIQLPGIDGITLTELAQRKSAPAVVWVTAYGCRGLNADAARLNVFRCLEKPVEVSEFRQIVRQALQLPV